MKKINLLAALLLAFALSFSFASAQNQQDWVSMMQNPNTNFYDVQKAFNEYYVAKKAELEQTEGSPSLTETGETKVPGFKVYKRWEWFQAPRVGPNGERFDPAKVWKEMEAYNKNHPPETQAGAWTFIGPSNTSTLSGAGRLNFVKLHPTNPNTIFVGSPSGGLWVSTDAGVTWNTNTDQLPQVIGCTDVAFDPINPNIMYMATGDGDAGDNYSVGLLKSLDGGLTWATTGLSFGMGQYKQMSKVMVDPTNGNNILVATTAGIWRSTNAGVSFTMVQAGSFKDMESMPGTPSTIYVCGTNFYRSTNNGATWTIVTSGLPSATLLSRMAIAVTAADPARIYLIAMKTTYDTYGVYRSTNSGTSWTTLTTNSPNIGTQGWYDLAIAANPTNAQEIMLAGQTQFLKSINGGTSWSTIGTTTHVDYHDIVYTSSTTAYVASDGGLYRTTNNGTSFTNLNNNLAISQMYGFGQSATTNNLLITGWQDNGTNRWNGTWTNPQGGDGMLCFVSFANNTNMWASYYNGAMTRSTNGGASFSNCGVPTGTGAWVTPYKESPVTQNYVYCGFQNMFRSTNGGVSWTALGTLPGGPTETITQFAISPANANVIWVSKAGKLYLTTNNGGLWTQITTVPPGNISYIACHNTDVNKAWITYSGFTNSNKVFQTANQGTSWTNLSASLPNTPVNCIEYINGSSDGLYIGTDNGVFYKDATLSVWQPFSSGLPNVVVTQIENYAAGNKLRCSTYGRGMWESPYYVPGAYAPAANFGASVNNACPGASIQFTDYSSGVPTSWLWSFPGGTPSSSTAQNPVVSYPTAGTYSVTLTATNVNGNSSVTVNSYVVIANGPPAPVGTPNDTITICAPGGIVNLAVTPQQPGTVRWWNQPAAGTQLATGNTYSPNISTTTTYWVDQTFPSGSPGSVGPTSNSMGAGAMFVANDIRGLYFDVLTPIILNSVDCYVNSDGDRTIEVIDALGNTYCDTTIFMFQNPTSPISYTVNFTLYPGSYFIKCRGFVDLYRNSTGAVYPYATSAVSITNSNAGTPGYYYFFYNWQYTNIVCNTNRTPITGQVVICSGMEGLFAEGNMSVYPNPNNGQFDVSFKTDNTDNYTIKVYNALGEVVYSEKVDNFSGSYNSKIDIAIAGKGVYMLEISNGKNQSVKRVIVF